MQEGMNNAPSPDPAPLRIGQRILAWSGRMAGVALLLLLAIQFASVAGRAALGDTSVWLQESVSYFHVLTVTLAVGWTLMANRHVRIDALQPAFRERVKGVIERIGLVMVVGACFAIAVLSWGFVSASWQVLEGSREIGGLPGVFLLKTLVPMLTLSLALAAWLRLRDSD